MGNSFGQLTLGSMLALMAATDGPEVLVAILDSSRPMIVLIRGQTTMVSHSPNEPQRPSRVPGRSDVVELLQLVSGVVALLRPFQNAFDLSCSYCRNVCSSYITLRYYM